MGERGREREVSGIIRMGTAEGEVGRWRCGEWGVSLSTERGEGERDYKEKR